MLSKLEPIQTEFLVSELNDNSPITFDTTTSHFTFNLNTLNKVNNYNYINQI